MPASAYIEEVKFRIACIVVTVTHDFESRGIDPSMVQIVQACRKTEAFSELMFDIPNLVFSLNDTDELVINIPERVIN